ncbi:TIGR01621 family pseudouridine synthase [Iodobacter ciconiae]|uniref:TIGR01621 family pseudouridine synthase n=1 Tax=Iodobacter ciconiae TaxID=2496266 RepID=A0A3S8ZV73_9NEIS|nr:TIGR01621 family pseudouridine synthase [Iodobacter ciconiae]AZN37366.1 TIGR01621 family pseudouridine synthase [Iodobacter ciconiae]
MPPYTNHLVIVYEHPDFLVAIKPAGLSFHQEEGEAGFVERLRKKLGGIRLWPVHRLDKLTSGLLIFAKNTEAAHYFGAAFAEHRIQKYYLAISDKKPLKKQGWIKGAMEKGRGGSWRLSRDGELKVATQFFSYGNIQSGKRLFVLKPLSGRTHQLRVALKSLGSPILGDERYGGTPADRGYLHAWALDFDYHGERQQILLAPDTGLDFQGIETQLAAIPAPWDLAWPK